MCYITKVSVLNSWNIFNSNDMPQVGLGQKNEISSKLKIMHEA